MDLLGMQDKQKQATGQDTSDESKQVGEHNIKKHGSVSKDQLNKGAWTPDKFAQNAQEAVERGQDPVAGIIVPGEVDEEHKKFLKTTTFVD